MAAGGPSKGGSHRPNQLPMSPLDITMAAEGAASSSATAEVADLGAISPVAGVAISRDVSPARMLQWPPHLDRESGIVVLCRGFLDFTG